MNKKNILILLILCTVVIVSCITFKIFKNKTNKIETKELSATVISKYNKQLIVSDKNDIIYTFNIDDIDVVPGSSIIIEYTGVLDKNNNIQDSNIVDYTTVEKITDENGIPTDWLDNGIFSDYYILAFNKLQELTLDEKIGQLFLVRYPDNNAIDALEKYKLGGYLFFEKDFKDKTKQEVINMIDNLQNVSDILLLTAVDEEGGNVVRVSSNTNLRNEKFKSPSEIYSSSGFDGISADTIEKSKLLNSLGLNLNLAPVVDVSTNSNDYIYERTLKQDTYLTKEYAKTVIEASQGTQVSYTLKHFPGYGNNEDTHTGSSIDTRTYDEILNNDLPPFKSGIEVGAEAILTSHNTVTSIDPDNPASLSANIHNLLINELKFTGISITDDLSMGAVSSIDNAAVKAILAGNNLIISTDYENNINDIKTAVQNGNISEEHINKLTFKILAWKYYKGLIFDEK